MSEDTGKSKKVPKLRFPGFTDDWEQRRLGEVSYSYSGGTPSAGNKEYYGGMIPFIRSGEISSSCTELFLTEKGFENSSASMIDEGDILYALYGATSGEVSKAKIRGAINQAILAIKPIEGYESEYILQYLQNMKGRILARYLQGGQGNLSAKIIKELIIHCPGTFEQKQIGQFFELLDHHITFQQRKLDHLKERKKALLQKMFPKEGTNVPEIRFPGFTDAWEQRRLGEVAHFINGRAYKQEELLNEGKYKVLRVGNFYTNDSWYYSDFELADKYYINKGDLVYTWSATFGPHIWSGEKVIYHYHIWKIELSKYLERNFTLQVLEADKDKLLSNTNGSTMIHITKGDMENKIISLPNINEQKKIGEFFEQLDQHITVQQRKLDHLKLRKKALLQQMFV